MQRQVARPDERFADVYQDKRLAICVYTNFPRIGCNFGNRSLSILTQEKRNGSIYPVQTPKSSITLPQTNKTPKPGQSEAPPRVCPQRNNHTKAAPAPRLWKGEYRLAISAVCDLKKLGAALRSAPACTRNSRSTTPDFRLSTPDLPLNPSQATRQTQTVRP